MIPAIRILRSYAPEVTVGFVPLDPNDQYYGEYDSDLGFTFTELFLQQDDLRRKYIVLHEVAHYFTQSADHGDAFYEKLTKLIRKHRIPMSIAKEIEGIYPSWWVEAA